MYLKPTGVSYSVDVELARDRVDEMRRGHRARQAAGDFALALQVEREQRQDHVRRDEAVAVVDDAEAVGVAVGGQAEVEAFVGDDLAQLAEVFLIALGREAAEVRVAIVVDDLDLDARLEEEVVEVIARGAVERIDGDAQAALADRVDVDLLLAARRGSGLSDRSPRSARPSRRRRRARPVAATLLISSSICFVISGSAGAPFDVENFRPLYSGGLCEAVKLIAPIALRRTVSNDDARRGHVARAEVGLDVVEGEDAWPLPTRTFRRGSGCRTRRRRRVPFWSDFLQVVGDALAGDADVVEGEILSDDAAPARGPEFDHVSPINCGDGNLAQRWERVGRGSRTTR